MPFQDLREFIAKLEKEKEALRIEEEVDWNLEVGAITRWSDEAGLPAPFFQKIKGYSGDYRIFGEPLSNHKRVAIAMDMDPNSSVKSLIDEYGRRKQSVIKPILTHAGPCKENIRRGNEVDLLEFPVPFIHDDDGGRYIGTWHLTICKDLNSNWVNWGMYRHMLHDKNSIGLQAGPPTHVRRILQGWKDRGKPMEIAIVLGVEPISTLCAAAPIPYGVSEVDIAGGIRGEPIELIKCETVDLEVPATSEIVIEGEVGLHETMEEGPFGEYTGYMGGHREQRPVIHVKAVTYRNHPILTVMNEGMPVTGTHATQSVTRSAECLEMLRASGIPVTAAYEHTDACTLLIVVAVRAGLARADDVAHVIWGSRLGVSTPYVIVVEEDVDPFDLKQVLHAIASKCHPYRGIVRLERARGQALIPWLSRYEQRHLLGARVYFDCTWPPDWDPSDVPQKCSFNNMYPSDIQQRALAMWRKYGFEKG
jgi:4-hydroxy-3-polyprenylbenzoate decarboxylase